MGRRGLARSRLWACGALLPRGRRLARPTQLTCRSARRVAGAARARAAARAPGGGPCFFTDLLAELELSAPRSHRRCGIWCGPVRSPTTLGRPCARHARRSPHTRCGAGSRGGRKVARAAGASADLRCARAALVRARRCRAAGRSTLALFGEEAPREQGRSPGRNRGVARAPPRSAELLLERYGCSPESRSRGGRCRRLLGSCTGRSPSWRRSGVCRRGYFVEGLGGAQFALPGAVERLRARASDGEVATLVLAAVDPAQPYGAVLPWPRREGQTRRPARVAGAMWCSSPRAGALPGAGRARDPDAHVVESRASLALALRGAGRCGARGARRRGRARAG